jgi:predicted negative regulator of RcsB-dependent stress response
MYITIGVGIILILAVFLPDMIGKKKKEDEDEEASAVRTEIVFTTEENERLKAEIERLKSETAHYSSGELAQLASPKERDKSK